MDEIKETIESIREKQRKLMKELTGDENAPTMNVLDEWMNEKYPDEK